MPFNALIFCNAFERVKNIRFFPGRSIWTGLLSYRADSCLIRTGSGRADKQFLQNSLSYIVYRPIRADSVKLVRFGSSRLGPRPIWVGPVRAGISKKKNKLKKLINFSIKIKFGRADLVEKLNKNRPYLIRLRPSSARLNSPRTKLGPNRFGFGPSWLFRLKSARFAAHPAWRANQQLYYPWLDAWSFHVSIGFDYPFITIHRIWYRLASSYVAFLHPPFNNFLNKTFFSQDVSKPSLFPFWFSVLKLSSLVYLA